MRSRKTICYLSYARLYGGAADCWPHTHTKKKKKNRRENIEPPHSSRHGFDSMFFRLLPLPCYIPVPARTPYLYLTVRLKRLNHIWLLVNYRQFRAGGPNDNESFPAKPNIFIVFIVWQMCVHSGVESFKTGWGPQECFAHFMVDFSVDNVDWEWRAEQNIATRNALHVPNNYPESSDSILWSFHFPPDPTAGCGQSSHFIIKINWRNDILSFTIVKSTLMLSLLFPLIFERKMFSQLCCVGGKTDGKLGKLLKTKQFILIIIIQSEHVVLFIFPW